MKFHRFVLTLILLMIYSINATTLDSLAIKYGTDKSSCFHAYARHYEKYFESLRDKPVKFLEIGFCQGASAHMWEDYFIEGDLFFIDVDPVVLLRAKEFNRVHLDLVNQEDVVALNHFIERVGGNFDIIVDDGGHTMQQQITSFKVLFPHVKKGGIYVIEDLHTSYPYGPNYATNYGCGNPFEQTGVNFLKMLVDCINLPGARTTCADPSKCPSHLIADLPEYVKEIESIHFYCSLAFIIKK